MYVLGAGILAVLLAYLGQLYLRGEISTLVRTLRWILGGGAVGAAALLAIGGRAGPASLLGLAGLSILLRGTLGPLDFRTTQGSAGNTSKVRTRYLVATLDHDTGHISGTVVAGQFAGTDLHALGSDEAGALLVEIAHDADSLALFETFLDAHHPGWRDGAEAGARSGGADPSGGFAGSGASGQDARDQAYAILGLEPGATPEEIRSAHRAMMKRVHPDQGGSTFLAAKINDAKDLLLRHHGQS